MIGGLEINEDARPPTRVLTESAREVFSHLYINIYIYIGCLCVMHLTWYEGCDSFSRFERFIFPGRRRFSPEIERRIAVSVPEFLR